MNEALLHQACHAIQGASPPPQLPISPLSGCVEPLNTAWYQITFVNCGVVKVRDVVLLSQFCCDIYFCVHQYHLVPIYLSVRASDVVETVTFKTETKTWLKFRDETETETLS